MPLRIALVGAPGSGKTELAEQLQKALPPRSCLIVDNYVTELTERTNIAFSHYANYLGNCQVAIERHNAEVHQATYNPETVVTCGTILESTIYAALHALANAKTDGGLQDKRAQITMLWLGVMANDTWQYTHAYYLPYDGSDDWELIVDEHIDEAAESLGIKLTPLPKERDERVGMILQEVLESDAETTATEE